MDTLERIDALAYDKARLEVQLGLATTTLRILENALVGYGALYDIPGIDVLVGQVRVVAKSAETVLANTRSAT